MAKNAVTDWDTTAANNTDVGGVNIQGTAPVSNMDDALRTIMAQIATFRTGASFTGTTALGSSATITSTASGYLLTLESTDAGATFGPSINLYRNSASPAASDVVGLIQWNGRDSAGNIQSYGDMYGLIIDPTSTSEDFSLNWETYVAGANGLRMSLGAGLYMAGATGTDKGAGTINATGYYLNGTALPTAAYATAAQYRANTASLTLQTDAVWSAAAEVTLTDAATITVDMSTFINAVVTLGGNRTLGNPTNEKVGQSGVIRIVQDATGSRTLSYGTDWEFAGGIAPTLSTTANAQDLLFYYVIATDRIFGNLVKATA
jgi:hypothetical protein